MRYTHEKNCSQHEKGGCTTSNIKSNLFCFFTYSYLGFLFSWVCKYNSAQLFYCVCSYNGSFVSLLVIPGTTVQIEVAILHCIQKAYDVNAGKKAYLVHGIISGLQGKVC